MQYTIREIEPKDFDTLIDIFKEFALFEKTPEKMINSAQQMESEKEFINGFVALDSNNNIAGYVTWFFAYYTWVGKSMYMDDLYVRQERRGNGLGTQLINRVIEKAKTENCKRLRWQVSDWNKPAIAFYGRLGATIDSVELNCDLTLV